VLVTALALVRTGAAALAHPEMPGVRILLRPGVVGTVLPMVSSNDIIPTSTPTPLAQPMQMGAAPLGRMPLERLAFTETADPGEPPVPITDGEGEGEQDVKSRHGHVEGGVEG
jgi:hypothetical protein